MEFTKDQKLKLHAICKTDLEYQFMIAFIPMLYAEEGFSDVSCKEVATAMGVSYNIAKGILGSLVKKGFLFVGDDEYEDIIYLDNNLYELHPEWCKNKRSINHV